MPAWPTDRRGSIRATTAAAARRSRPSGACDVVLESRADQRALSTSCRRPIPHRRTGHVRVLRAVLRRVRRLHWLRHQQQRLLAEEDHRLEGAVQLRLLLQPRCLHYNPLLPAAFDCRGRVHQRWPQPRLLRHRPPDLLRMYAPPFAMPPLARVLTSRARSPFSSCRWPVPHRRSGHLCVLRPVLHGVQRLHWLWCVPP